MTPKWQIVLALVGGILVLPQTASAKGGSYKTLGGGLAVFGLTQAKSTGEGSTDFGVGFDARYSYRVAPMFALNFVFSWGLTGFHRTAEVAKGGVEAGRWTTRAFENTHKWFTENDERKGLYIFAIPAYMFLTMTFIAAPIAILASPIAATSFLNAGPTASFNFGGKNVDAFVEAGIGGILYFHPEEHVLLPGYGPLAGVGINWKRVGFGARLLWSPPSAQTKVEGINTHVFATVATLNIRM